MPSEIDDWLMPFGLDGQLHGHAAHVLQSLPDDVRLDIMGDAGVVFYDYQPGPGVVMQVPVRIPSSKEGEPIGRAEAHADSARAQLRALVDRP